jgi:vacuolar-type H+-ATPase subunit H
MTLLLDAESRADEIVKRAQSEAEEIITKAKRRADEIQKAAAPSPHTETEALRAGAQLEQQKNLIMEDASRRIEGLRSASATRFAEAVEKVVAELIGEP